VKESLTRAALVRLSSSARNKVSSGTMPEELPEDLSEDLKARIAKWQEWNQKIPAEKRAIAQEIIAKSIAESREKFSREWEEFLEKEYGPEKYHGDEPKSSIPSIKQPPESQSSQESKGSAQTVGAEITRRINSNAKLHILTWITAVVLCAIIGSLGAFHWLPLWGAFVLALIAIVLSPTIACLVAAAFLRGRYLEFIRRAKAEQDEFLRRREERRRERSFGFGIDTPPEQLHAFLVSQLYPPQQLIDTLSKGSDPDTAFIVTAACCTSTLWAALSVVLDHLPRKDIQQIHVSVIQDMAKMYKDERQTALDVKELRARIIRAWSSIWEAGMAHRDSSGRGSGQHMAEAACLLANQGQLDQAKVEALGTLLNQKYLIPEGLLQMLKRNRRL
jgi:hypothetical protein